MLLIGDFEKYGVSLVHFFITTIIKPEDDSTFKRFKELHFRQYADIAEGFSKNKGGNNMANLGVGIGVMIGVGGTVSGVINNSLENVTNLDIQNTKFIKYCFNSLFSIFP